MKLISKTEFEELIDIDSVSDSEFRLRNRKYRNFLKKPLTHGMFVSCDDNGNVLEEPEIYEITAKTGTSEKELEWIEALSKVLFKDIKKSRYEYWIEDIKIIEDLIPYNLDLAVYF